MRPAGLTLTMTIALLVTGGSVRAQPFDNPELADVQTAFFYDYGRSHSSVIMATMYGSYRGVAFGVHGARYGWTKNGAIGVGVFALYEADDIKRTGAGNWQTKQSDWVQMAFWISTPFGRTFSHAAPFFYPVTGLLDYFGSPVTYTVPMYYIGSASVAQLEGCSASIATKDRNRNGLPETASWKAGCSKNALSFLSKDDQKLYKKVVKGLKGKGVAPAYRAVRFPPFFP